MNQLLIGDCHFGVKSNSLFWLESQLEFFEKQIIPIIEEKEINRVIFLGDLTDIRYSINQQIGIELQKLIRKMLCKFENVQFIMIAGNHDYYSPLEEFVEYNSYNMLFTEEFLKVHKNLTIVNESPLLLDDGALFLPWYYTENVDHFDEILYEYDFKRDVKAIFCHTDTSTWPGARIASLRGAKVYSGHIHYIVNDEIANLHNIGASMAFTFNDVNQDRYVYILNEDFQLVEKIKNITTPKFVRIYDEGIFNIDESLFENSYIQLCISSEKLNKAKYVEQIKLLKNNYPNSNIKVHSIDDITNYDTLAVDGFTTNIDTYIEENIPDHLTEKFVYIKKKMNDR